jgi:hypothetical protein
MVKKPNKQLHHQNSKRKKISYGIAQTVQLKFTVKKCAYFCEKEWCVCIHYFADSTFLLFEQRISSFVGAAMKMRLAEGTWDRRLWQQKCEFC